MTRYARIVASALLWATLAAGMVGCSDVIVNEAPPLTENGLEGRWGGVTYDCGQCGYYYEVDIMIGSTNVEGYAPVQGQFWVRSHTDIAPDKPLTVYQSRLLGDKDGFELAMNVSGNPHNFYGRLDEDQILLEWAQGDFEPIWLDRILEFPTTND